MTKINHFKIGLFFIGSLLLGIGALVWIGAAGIFQNTRVYATYFNESVGGLGSGSDVQYLGLSVGKVADIDLVPDRKLVRVLMEIKSGFEIRESMAVQNKLAGITGNRYLNLMEPPEDVKQFTPKEPLGIDYPVIPSVQGQFARVEDALEAAYGKIESIDFEELIREWKMVAENANSILAKEQIDRIVADLSEVSGRLERVTAGLGKPETAKQFDRAFDDLSAAAQSSRAASRSLEQQLEKVPEGALADVMKRMNATLQQIETATTSTNQDVNETLVLLRQTLQQTNRMISEFQMLARSLRREPGRILTQPTGEEPFEK